MTLFFNIFAASPFKPIQSHMENVNECVKALMPFFKASFANDWVEAQDIQKKIATFEDKADEIKKDIRNHLPKSIFMPVSRVDLLSLITVQDSIANKAKDIAGLVYGRKMDIPKSMQDSFYQLVEGSVATSVQLKKAIDMLDELIETGFKGHEAEHVDDMITELERLERVTDVEQVATRTILFQMEKSLSPVDVIFLYKIIEWTGEIGDLAQSVGHRLQIMMAHQ